MCILHTPNASVRGCDGASARGCDGASARGCDGASARGCDGASARGCDGASARGCDGASARGYDGASLASVGAAMRPRCGHLQEVSCVFGASSPAASAHHHCCHHRQLYPWPSQLRQSLLSGGCPAVRSKAPAAVSQSPARTSSSVSGERREEGGVDWLWNACYRDGVPKKEDLPTHQVGIVWWRACVPAC